MISRTPEQAERRKLVRAKCYLKYREANLEYAAAYRAENLDTIKEKVIGKHAAYSAFYRERNYQKCLEMTQAWKVANPERRKETNANWSKANLPKHRTYQHNRRARKAASGGTLSADLAVKLYNMQRGLCACCEIPLGSDYEMDHIIPLALGGSNTDDNIQLLTSRCNRQKGAKPPIEFMQSRGRLL